MEQQTENLDSDTLTLRRQPDGRGVDAEGNFWFSVNGDQSAVGTELVFRSLAQIATSDYAMTWLIKGWWPHPSFGQKAGPEKALKSWLDVIENVCIASGRPLFDRFDVITPGPVVVFSGEIVEELYYRRVRHVGRSLGLSDAEIRKLPIYVTDDRASTRSPRFQSALETALERYEPVKVSLDPLYSYHGADVEASNLHASAEVLNAVSGPVSEAGGSLCIVNHFRKDAGGRPKLVDITQAGGREWVDSWVLVSHRSRPNLAENRFALQLNVGSRHWGGHEWDLDICLGGFDENAFEHTGHITWELHEPQDADAAKEAQMLASMMFVRELGSVTRASYAERAGITPQQAGNRLRELVKDGLVTVNKDHLPHVYTPAEVTR